MDEATQPSTLLIVGADHKSSTMMLRDKLLMSDTGLASFADRLRGAGFHEAMVLSTVDRTEILLVAEAEDAAEEIRHLLAAQTGLSRGEIAAGTYALRDREAVKHLFAVTAGLDSLVVGDPRVIVQMRAAIDFARRRGAIGLRLVPLLERALALAEVIDRETELARRPSSIPAAAVHVARDLHGDLGRCRALLVGAGEMGELLAAALVTAGLAHLVVTHPQFGRAEAAAQTLNCHAADFADLVRQLEAADIVLTSMNTRRHVLTRDAVQTAIAARRHKPIFLIDTGVPGDIDPDIAKVEDAFLYTIDDLERVTRRGPRGHEKTVARAWDMVAGAAAEFADPNLAPAAGGKSADAVETLRRESLRLAGGDADKATRLLVERLLRLKKDN